MESLKKLERIKNSLGDMELVFQDEIQEVLTNEIIEGLERLNSNILQRAQKVRSMEDLQAVENELKVIRRLQKKYQATEE